MTTDAECVRAIEEISAEARIGRAVALDTICARLRAWERATRAPVPGAVGASEWVAHVVSALRAVWEDSRRGEPRTVAEICARVYGWDARQTALAIRHRLAEVDEVPTMRRIRPAELVELPAP